MERAREEGTESVRRRGRPAKLLLQPSGSKTSTLRLQVLRTKKQLRMGKRKRLQEIHAREEVSNTVEDKIGDNIVKISVKNIKGNVKNRKEVIITPSPPTNGKHSKHGELKATDSAQKRAVADPGSVLNVRKCRRQVNNLTGKVAVLKSIEEISLRSRQSGVSGMKKSFTWNPDREIIALSELAKSVSMDAGQSADKKIHWEKLAGRVGKRLDCDLTHSQMYEKARRLKERYSSVDQTISEGKLDSFKNADEEKIYNLSHQIWGNRGAVRLYLEEEEHDFLTGKLERRFSDAVGSHEDDSQQNVEDEIPELNMEKENAPSEDLNQPSHPRALSSQGQEENAAGESCQEQIEKPAADLASDMRTHAAERNTQRTHAMEGDTQRTFEVFHVEHQALLTELQKSCEAVLEEMQAKFLIMINNTVRQAGGSHAPPPWMEGSRCIPSLDYMQTPVSCDSFVGKLLAVTRSQGINKSSAFESLEEQWRQRRLEELKLTSLKLRVMLEECKIEQEKLEKQIKKY